MNSIILGQLPAQPDGAHPTELFKTSQHTVYWLGIDEDTSFRSNVYLIVDGKEALIVDPGCRRAFWDVKRRVAQILPPERLTGMILCHQDPDVCASMVDWLEIQPEMKVYTTLRTHVLLPYYGRADYAFVDVGVNPRLRLPSGKDLQFIEAPFLHFPGAFTTYDHDSRFLLSGDIWAAIGSNWSLVVENFVSHSVMMDMFHIDYMASNNAARGFVRKLQGIPIDAILPQHGSIIDSRHVEDALEYLNELECGLDLLYPDLQR
jgi:flavorubredoxin